MAARCGVSRDTIRFYERSGLLPRPRRTAARHRLYDERAAEQVTFIRRAQDLGLTLDDIRQLLALREFQSAAAVRRVEEVLRTRLEHLEARLADVQGLRDRLADALARASGRSREPLPTVLGLPENGLLARRKEA